MSLNVANLNLLISSHLSGNIPMRNLLRVGWMICVLALPHLGCSSKSDPRVTGTLIDNGQSVKVAENEAVEITFFAAKTDAAVNQAIGEFDAATGAFRVRGPEKEGIPPGEYKIAIACSPLDDDSKDRFAGKFTEENTPLRYTVTDHTIQEIVIDVGKKTVTKKQ
jgi:hypothetical protein